MPALGLVDEMDDPSPGHMSDHPTPLSSVTTMPDAAKSSRPFLGSLDQRFVKSEDTMDVTTQTPTESDSMEMDEDKENAKS
jgi:serine/threonine-protein phosphatase 4 regulatory subunit 2